MDVLGKIYNNLRIRFIDKLIVECALVGILCGLLMVAFRILLEASVNLRSMLLSGLSYHPVMMIPFTAVLIVVAFLVIKLCSWEPSISGSGIPQIQNFLQGRAQMNWKKVLIGKTFGTLLVLGSGLSLGQEGPSIQLGGAVGKGVGALFGHDEKTVRLLVTGGVSAGLAAVFNAPLAGVIFALEEIHKQFSPQILTTSLVAAVSADFVSKFFLGMNPILDISNLNILPLRFYYQAIVLGVVVAIVGIIFNKMMSKFLDYYNKSGMLSKEHKKYLPYIGVAGIAFSFPELIGSGHHILLHVGALELSVAHLALLFSIKFLFTIICSASGAPGGVFLPMLALGCLVGEICGIGLIQWFGLPSIYILNMAIFAMLAFFTAVVRAPITGIILICELVGTFQHLLPLATVAIVAYLTADIMGCKPLYKILAQKSCPCERTSSMVEDVDAV